MTAPTIAQPAPLGVQKGGAGSGAVGPTDRDFTPRKLKVMLGCLLGTSLGSHFLTISAVAIVMAPMTAQFHWSRAGLSGAVTILLLVGAFMTAVWGRLIDRFGVRWIVICGTLAVGIVTASLSLTTSSLVQFYLCFAALGICGSTAVGYSKVVGSLFTRNRGKALALFGMEASLVAAVAPQIILQLESRFGWRGMFVGLGLIVIAVAGVLVFLLDEIGGIATPTKGAAVAQPVLEGMTIAQVRQTPTFWLINLATMAGNITATGLLPHLVALVLSRGMSAQTAVTALTVHTVAIPAGQFCGGVWLDQAKTARVAAPFAIVALIGLLVLAWASPHSGGAMVLLAGAGLLGFGNGAKRSMNTYFFTRFFGLRALAEVSGWSLAITSMLLAPAPLLFGVIYDRTKSYNGALWVLGLGLALAVAFYLMLGPYRYAASIGRNPAAAPNTAEELGGA
jgi:MFS family permease